MPLRIVIISPRPSFRSMLGSAVTTQLGVKVTASFSGANAVSVHKHNIEQASVMVVDASKPLEALSVIKATRQIAPACGILVILNSIGDYLSTLVMALGASGVATEFDELEEWIDAIKAIARGAQFQSSQVVALRRHPAISAKLTPKEALVLPLVCRGFSDEAVAGELGLSPSTVEGHRVALLGKLGVADTASLLVLGIQLGVVAACDVDCRSRTRKSARGSRKRQTPVRLPAASLD